MNAAHSTGRRRNHTWALWLVLTLVSALALGRRMTNSKSNREVFLPGRTTHGHYQIELECGACHTEGFSETEDFQGACIECHEGELEEAQDSHPESKFTDPRNADRVAKLDARFCVTCHSEHQPERTGSMGLSLPVDYCYHCHEDIAEERESHEGLPFDSCASAGCHNFHDNRALYEDFLVRHGREAKMSVQPARVLAAEFQDCPSEERHSLSEQTDVETCKECHQAETTTWLAGRHGMRVAQGLSPMRVRDARLPMKENPDHATMTCSACHSDPQAKETAFLEIEACLGCHDDRHSQSYKESPHYAFFESEEQGRVARGSGATCASCHMPRLKDEDGNLWVNHNQNDNLRPNEKMIRSACMNCHGLPFSIDALADEKLIESNFSGAPDTHVLSVDYALARE